MDEKKPFSQSLLRTDKLRDSRLLNEWDSDRLMRVPVKRSSSMGEKLGTFSNPMLGALPPSPCAGLALGSRSRLRGSSLLASPRGLG